MSNHTLEEIVAVEKEVQARLAEEHRKAVIWRDGERERIARETEAELDEARQQCRQRIAAAEAETDDGIDELVRRAESYSARLQGLSEEKLRGHVSQHLQRLLPEKQP